MSCFCRFKLREQNNYSKNNKNAWYIFVNIMNVPGSEERGSGVWGPAPKIFLLNLGQFRDF